MKIEICINSDKIDLMVKNILTSYRCGADTIELCSDMKNDGLTPTKDQIIQARKAFSDRKGLMVMIRNRPGNFVYTSNEIEIMCNQIEIAAENGADGVVVGALTLDNHINEKQTDRLISKAKKLNLKTTFHRAFDAVENTEKAIEFLIKTKIDRILTCGIPWGQKGNTLDGINVINQTIYMCDSKIEVVLGGGINLTNLKQIIDKIDNKNAPIAIHTYSGILVDGVVSEESVKGFSSILDN